MLDGLTLIDVHQHPVRLSTVKPSWLEWAQRFGQPGWRDAYSADGVISPRAFDELMAAEGVDHSVLICEYSPKTIYDNALAIGFSRGFLVSAGIAVISLLTAVFVVRVKRADLAGEQVPAAAVLEAEMETSQA